jgi:hypothetical protein
VCTKRTQQVNHLEGENRIELMGVHDMTAIHAQLHAIEANELLAL